MRSSGKAWRVLNGVCGAAAAVCGRAGRVANQRFRSGRLAVYLEPRDAWVGAYVAEHAVYVCPIPFVVFRWTRVGSK